MLKSLISNGVIFAVTYILHIDCSRACLHITLFTRVQPSVRCVANSSFAFGNFLVFLNSNICNPWLVEGNDVKTKDMKGQLHGSKGQGCGIWSLYGILVCHSNIVSPPPPLCSTLPLLQTCWACFFLTALVPAAPWPGMLSPVCMIDFSCHSYLFIASSCFNFQLSPHPTRM